MNTCYFCGAKLKKEKVDIARYWGKELIALEDVPALICTQCGEKYFEAKVSYQIDDRIQAVLRRKTPVQTIDIPVVQF